MEYRSIRCGSLLKTITKKDMLFHGDYCIDPYQNCEFGCTYCDSSFEKTIFVKMNAPDLLSDELAQAKNGRIIIGSVHDPYQPAENTYGITRQLLQIIKQYDFPCHILTKSPLILRDVDLLSSINSYVTISMPSLQPKVLHMLEPDAPSPEKRLQTVQSLVKQGIYTGIAMIPVFPLITDQEIEPMISIAHEYNARYFLHKHLELKGDQRQKFEGLLTQHYPTLITRYRDLYQDDIKPIKSYRDSLEKIITTHCKTYKMANKILY